MAMDELPDQDVTSASGVRRDPATVALRHDQERILEPVPSTGSRVEVLNQADRLLAAVRRLPSRADADAVRDVERYVREARAIAQGGGRSARRLPDRLRDWWSGASVERAWGLLWLAEEQLALLEGDDDSLRARLPYLRRLVGRQPADAARAYWKQRVDRWDHGNKIDPADVHEILIAEHVRNAAVYAEMRRLRNLLLTFAVILAALVGGLWAGDVTRGDIVGLGALGGALGVAVALRDTRRLRGHYNLEVAQALLKIPAGAATAVMAVLVIGANGADISGLHGDLYAVIFGFSQQAFTRLVDQKAEALTATTPPRAGETPAG
jgi:hypothetical protein